MEMKKFESMLDNIAAIVGAMIGTAVLAFALAWVIKVCWNYAFVTLFGFPIITYWQAYAIYILYGAFHALRKGERNNASK